MIYSTPYDLETLQATGASVDSGFDSMDQLREVMGPPDVSGARWCAYHGTAFSDFIFSTGRESNVDLLNHV